MFIFSILLVLVVLKKFNIIIYNILSSSEEQKNAILLLDIFIISLFRRLALKLLYLFNITSSIWEK